MSLFKNKMSKSKSPKSKSIKNTIALKRGLYSVILSVIFIVAVVLVTIFATALAERFPLELDLTSDKLHSMTGDNVEFIKSVNKKVNVYVCLTEDEYSCTSSSGYNMAYYAALNRFVDNNAANKSYYQQTVELLNKYQMYNDNITVTYVDVSQPTADEITGAFDDYKWVPGEILVDSTFMVDGKEITRRTYVPFDETYTLVDESGQASTYFQYFQQGMSDCYALYGQGVGYTITENKVEYALSAAIYKVTSESTPVFLVPKSYCNAEAVSSGLESTLTANNFTVDYAEGFLSDLLVEANYDYYSGVILAGTSDDISDADRVALEKFLDNKGKKGKSFFYFASTKTYKFENLCGFLADWGIGFKPGILYLPSEKTSEGIMFSSLKTEYTKLTDSMNKYLVASNVVPMIQLYDTNTTATYIRETNVLMQTRSGNFVIKPMDAGEDWTPDEKAETDMYASAIYTEDAISDDQGNYICSQVVAYAAENFISPGWTQNYSTVVNMNFVLDTFNVAAGLTENPFNFVAKTITNESYRINVTEGKAKAVRIIFMAVVPITLVGTGIAVWIRRRRK